MMIQTDLYRETLASKRETHRRTALYVIIASVIFGGALSLWLVSYGEVLVLRKRLAAEQASGHSVSSELKAARERARALEEKRKARDAVLKFAKQRVNWAPLLEEIFASVSENMEISSVQATCFGQEDCTIHVTGRAAAEQPRLECDKFRLVLVELFQRNGIKVSGDFAQLQDSTSTIQLAEAKYPVADFTLDLRWKNAAFTK